MIKRELTNVVSFLLGVALIFTIAVYAFSAEGMKTIQFMDGTSIQVPEMAPSWMDKGWIHEVKSVNQFPGGKAIIVFHINEDGSVAVASLEIVPANQDIWITVGFTVIYKNRPKQLELYEDDAYIKAGKASGVFVRLPSGTVRTGAEYIGWIKEQKI